MGRASGNGMSGVLIYTGQQDWSEWEACKLLLSKANDAGLKGLRLLEIEQLKSQYFYQGTHSKQKYAELSVLVEDILLKRNERECSRPKFKPVKKRRRLR